jgi:hypothetical protein
MSKIFTLLVINVLAVAGMTFLRPAISEALSGSEFQAGRITDDNVFFNGGGMDVSTIQRFLDSKVPVCDTNGTKSYGGTTRAIYGTSVGHPPPYICLKDYTQETPSRGSEVGLCNAYQGGSKSSAQIIYDIAQSCGINPRVLVVLLEKEQSLVTDDWPWDTQYRSATGYGCPDTAPCDAEYYGFFNQVYSAARQFKRYARDSSLFSYRPYRNNYIQYNPNASCGGSQVDIQNQATAGLYNYTPYQPNASALANLYGSGDSCGAYGNRNYWRIYNDWFGNTYGPPFAAQYVSQSPYPVIDSGVGVSVFIKFRNVGTAFWKDDRSTFPGYLPVHLATTFPINRSSAFRADNWLSPSRATGTISAVYNSDGTLDETATNQHTVQPGQTAEFRFTVFADPAIPGGVYREYFQPIVEGAPGYSWNMSGWAYLDIGVNKPTYKAAYHSQSPYPTIAKGSSANVTFKFKNTGTSPWLDNTSVIPGKLPVHLATSWPINRPSIFSNGWPSSSRPNLLFSKVYEADGSTLASAQHTVQPGQVGEFTFPITVPTSATSGFYQEHFQPIVEGAPGYSWNMEGGVWIGVTVP